MRNLNKIGFIILLLVWPISYYLKHINPLENQLLVDYLITIGYCLGTSILAFCKGIDEFNRKAKYLFYYTIAVFSTSVILIYLIDLLIDPIFGTTKVIWATITTTIISLCIYLFQQR